MRRRCGSGFAVGCASLASGRTVGGGSFSRGHIHQMLSNPLYAGRIRHKRLVHDGQHAAIIAPDLWEAVQAGLADNAARERGTGNAGERSPFAGKLFDETGDRLTPSHANKRGVRHRYYVSHRLVQPGGASDGSGWRLPARALEQAIVQVLVAKFRDPVFPASIAAELTASEIVRVRDALAGSGGPACRRGSGRRRSRRGSGAAGDDCSGLTDRRSRRPCPLVCSPASCRSIAARAASPDPSPRLASARCRSQAGARRAGARARSYR